MPHETAGDTFRRQVVERWRLADPELVVLDQAAGTLDVIEEFAGSDMPLRERARELRAQRLTFGRSLSQLALLDGEGGRGGEHDAPTGQARRRCAMGSQWLSSSTTRPISTSTTWRWLTRSTWTRSSRPTPSPSQRTRPRP